MPRNLDIFPSELGSSARSKQALHQPIQYTLSQLKTIFERAYRDEDHFENIYISSAQYCKQKDDPQHEFLLLEVRDQKVPKISNFLVLDRSVQTPIGTYTAISTSISSHTPAHDRLRVSCYGDKDLLIKQCSLGPYDVLENLVFPSYSWSTPFLLYELVILALETSKARIMYNLMSAQCFWFASCVWECIQKLQPESRRDKDPEKDTRGRFGNFFRQDVKAIEVDDVLYRARLEITQFRMDLARGKEAAGRTKLNDNSVTVHQYRKENEDLRKELERLKGVAQGSGSMRVTPWGLMVG